MITSDADDKRQMSDELKPGHARGHRDEYVVPNIIFERRDSQDQCDECAMIWCFDGIRVAQQAAACRRVILGKLLCDCVTDWTLIAEGSVGLR